MKTSCKFHLNYIVIASNWRSSLTKENEEDLERVQKSAIRIILGRTFDDYSKALSDL